PCRVSRTTGGSIRHVLPGVRDRALMRAAMTDTLARLLPWRLDEDEPPAEDVSWCWAPFGRVFAGWPSRRSRTPLVAALGTRLSSIWSSAMMKWGQALSRTSVAWRTQALAAQRERWLRITGRC